MFLIVHYGNLDLDGAFSIFGELLLVILSKILLVVVIEQLSEKYTPLMTHVVSIFNKENEYIKLMLLKLLEHT